MDIAQTASFNSMKVRLKPAKGTGPGMRRRCFNSMKVRLKHGVLDAHHVPIVSFNSMKVRLKRLRVANMREVATFQFHEGPIKTHALHVLDRYEEGFNSMKVR